MSYKCYGEICRYPLLRRCECALIPDCSLLWGLPARARRSGGHIRGTLSPLIRHRLLFVAALGLMATISPSIRTSSLHTAHW
jgi:hypothetical protein